MLELLNIIYYFIMTLSHMFLTIIKRSHMIYCGSVDSFLCRIRNREFVPKSKLLKLTQLIKISSKIVPYYIFRNTIKLTTDIRTDKELMACPKYESTSIFNGRSPDVQISIFVY
jgi:ABC-type dipeptide/oligopeptide/nickel transport system permease subunit